VPGSAITPGKSRLQGAGWCGIAAARRRWVVCRPRQRGRGGRPRLRPFRHGFAPFLLAALALASDLCSRQPFFNLPKMAAGSDISSLTRADETTPHSHGSPHKPPTRRFGCKLQTTRP